MAKSEATDYILPIYKERALKHLVKLAGGKENLKLLDKEQLLKMYKAQSVIAKDMQFNQLKWFRPFKYQVDFFNTGSSHVRRGMIAANRSGKCCTASTLLDLPDGTQISYGEMYAKGESFAVNSWDGEKVIIATAIQPIKKPAEPCVRLWFEDGRWIEAALGHRVLNSKAEYVFCESLLASLPNLQASILECDQSAHVSNVLHLKKKLQDFLGDCLSESRLYDEQLRLATNTYRAWLQQPDDVQQLCCSVSDMDECLSICTNNLLTWCDHLSTQDVLGQIAGHFSELIDHFSCKTVQSCRGYIREFQRLCVAAIVELQSNLGLSPNPNQSSSLLNPFNDVAANKIVAYESIGCHDVYDFTVPETSNYISCGVVHHNTIASTYETAMHLTGRYPTWWKGKVFDHPVTVMATGESWEQVSKTLQSKILGCEDIKQGYKLGTGSIPRDCIDDKSIRTDGPNVLSIEIKHSTGGKSKLFFSNYTQQVRHLQGFELDLVVLDEQPPDEIFSELVTRTAQREGQVLCTFTPLKGMSGLVKKFWDKVDGYTHVRVGWKDVPFVNEWGEKFFSQKERDQLMKDYMPWERECRINGIPLIGKGVVFPLYEWPTYKSSDVDLRNNEKLERLISFDLGINNDPTVISFFFRDPVEEIIWLHRQVTVPEGETPDEYIHYLLDKESKGVPIALPHDAGQAGRYTLTEQSVREVFEDTYGLNCIPGAILNPANDQGKVTNHKAYGINIMRLGLERKTFRINEECKEFLEEARNYAIKDNGKFSDPDDHIDSARIGILALIQGHGETVVSRANNFVRYRPKEIDGKLQRI